MRIVFRVNFQSCSCVGVLNTVDAHPLALTFDTVYVYSHTLKFGNDAVHSLKTKTGGCNLRLRKHKMTLLMAIEV